MWYLATCIEVIILDILVPSLAVILAHYTTEIAHNAIFTCRGASVYCQFAKGRRASLPRDARDVLVLIEYPPEDNQPGWELDVRAALREGEIWNPKVHLKIEAARAADTDNEMVILGRVLEWAGQW